MVIVVIIVGSIVLGVGLFTSILDVCRELGPGIHTYNGATYECG